MIAAIDIGGTSIKFGVVDPTTDNFEYLGKIDTNTHLNDFKMENTFIDVAYYFIVILF